MNKKRITLATFIVLALVVLSGATAYAVTYLPKTDNIFNISNIDDCDTGFGQTRCATISTFRHNGNRCYVLTDRDNKPSSISCIRFEEDYARGQ